MFIFKVLMVWVILLWTKTVDRFGLKNVGIALTSLTLVLFGDIVVPAVFHFLHVIWEMVELVIEHFLESHFGLNPRQAEFVVAWMGILTMIGVFLKLVYEAYYYSVKLFYESQRKLHLLKADMAANPAKMSLILSAISLGTVGATFLFFS